MANGKLVEYIKKQLKAGYSVFNIKTALYKEGYPYQDVDEALGIAEKGVKTKKGINLFFYVSIILVSIIVLLVAILMLGGIFAALGGGTKVVYYALVPMFLLVAGAILTPLLNITSKTKKQFMLGCLIISFSVAMFILYLTSAFFSGEELEKIAQIEAERTEAVRGYHYPRIPPEYANPLLAGLLAMVYFNIVPVIKYWWKKLKAMSWTTTLRLMGIAMVIILASNSEIFAWASLKSPAIAMFTLPMAMIIIVYILTASRSTLQILVPMLIILQLYFDTKELVRQYINPLLILLILIVIAFFIIYRLRK